MAKLVEWAMLWLIVAAAGIIIIGMLISNNYIIVLGVWVWALGSYCKNIYIYPALATTKQIILLTSDRRV